MRSFQVLSSVFVPAILVHAAPADNGNQYFPTDGQGNQQNQYFPPDAQNNPYAPNMPPYLDDPFAQGDPLGQNNVFGNPNGPPSGQNNGQSQYTDQNRMPNQVTPLDYNILGVSITQFLGASTHFSPGPRNESKEKR